MKSVVKWQNKNEENGGGIIGDFTGGTKIIEDNGERSSSEAKRETKKQQELQVHHYVIQTTCIQEVRNTMKAKRKKGEMIVQT